jgi:PAS domain-containing protein
VKHLVQVNIDKEEALKKARADLEAKNKKIEEDDKAQQDPSDPESTTSSLTASTSSVGQRPAPKKRGSSDDHTTDSCNDNNGKKREKTSTTRWSKESNGTTHKSNHATSIEHTNAKAPKPMLSHESSLSSATSSAEEGIRQQNRIPGVSFTHTMQASVSDITDSNKGSSSEGNSSSSDGCRCEGNFYSRESGSVGGTGSVSSDAAVARGQDNHGHDTSHADVVVTKIRKRKIESASDASRSNNDEPTSLEKRFLLDYEEVFLKSNVPQILATTSGRIVAWNDFFLRITGLKAIEVERLTIFSLVQATRLSSLFEIVAASLRSGTAQTPNEFRTQSTPSIEAKTNDPVGDNLTDQGISSEATDTNQKIWNYCALTLPCVSFNHESYSMLNVHKKPKHSNMNSHENQDENLKAENHEELTKHESRPLYMTITLMTDMDPRKRCFHCVFTDCPGTNGNLGSVTPELLSILFTKQNMTFIEQRNVKRKKSNRAID